MTCPARLKEIAWWIGVCCAIRDWSRIRNQNGHREDLTAFDIEDTSHTVPATRRQFSAIRTERYSPARSRVAWKFFQQFSLDVPKSNRSVPGTSHQLLTVGTPVNLQNRCLACRHHRARSCHPGARVVRSYCDQMRSTAHPDSTRSSPHHHRTPAGRRVPLVASSDHRFARSARWHQDRLVAICFPSGLNDTPPIPPSWKPIEMLLPSISTIRLSPYRCETARRWPSGAHERLVGWLPFPGNVRRSVPSASQIRTFVPRSIPASCCPSGLHLTQPAKLSKPLMVNGLLEIV